MIKSVIVQASCTLFVSAMVALSYVLSCLIAQTWPGKIEEFTDYQFSLLWYLGALSIMYVVFMRLLDTQLIKDSMLIHAFDRNIYQRWYQIYTFGFVNILVFVFGARWSLELFGKILGLRSVIYADFVTVLIGVAFLLAKSSRFISNICDQRAETTA